MNDQLNTSKMLPDGFRQFLEVGYMGVGDYTDLSDHLYFLSLRAGCSSQALVAQFALVVVGQYFCCILFLTDERLCVDELASCALFKSRTARPINRFNIPAASS